MDNNKAPKDLLTMRRAKHKILQLFTFIPEQCFFFLILCVYVLWPRLHFRASTAPACKRVGRGEISSSNCTSETQHHPSISPLFSPPNYQKLGNFVQPNFCCVHLSTFAFDTHMAPATFFFRKMDNTYAHEICCDGGEGKSGWRNARVESGTGKSINENCLFQISLFSFPCSYVLHIKRQQAMRPRC